MKTSIIKPTNLVQFCKDAIDTKTACKKSLPFLYLPTTICNHIFGEKHTPAHRIVVGLIIAFLGVMLTKWLDSYHNELISLSGDFSGVSLHAIGLTPIIERMAKTAV